MARIYLLVQLALRWIAGLVWPAMTVQWQCHPIHAFLSKATLHRFEVRYPLDERFAGG